MRRGKPLEANREHDVELQGRSGPWGSYHCTRCGRSGTRLIEKVEAGMDPFPPNCKGFKPGSPPESRSRIPSVSDRRDEKRAKRGIYGPLCDHVRGSPCLDPLCGGTGEPAHVRGVGPGFGDFLRVDGQWIGNVLNLCRDHHRFLDGKVGGGGSPEAFARKYGWDVAERAREIGDDWMERHDIDPHSPVHPYEQLREAA